MLALLRQRRWAGFAVLTVAMCVLFWWLGTWQWGRHVERSARNDAIEAVVNEEPVALEKVISNPSVIDGGVVYRPVSATGTYLASDQLLQRNPLGRSGFDVITPLALSTGGALLVNRGWISSSPTDTNQASADVAPPVGPVDVTVRLRAPQESSGRQAPPGQVYDIVPEQLTEGLPSPVYAAYGQLLDQEPAPDPTIELAGPIDTGLGIHLFYAIQWWLFIVIAVVGYFAVLRRESREGSETDTQPEGAGQVADQSHPLN
ncbi:MAG: SURF1 family protein [Actinomycetia bacterium]|nr:SURF1 family protein [Actinomycetes bacterium]